MEKRPAYVSHDDESMLKKRSRNALVKIDSLFLFATTRGGPACILGRGSVTNQLHRCLSPTPEPELDGTSSKKSKSLRVLRYQLFHNLAYWQLAATQSSWQL
jgi:hypothetical protein